MLLYVDSTSYRGTSLEDSSGNRGVDRSNLGPLFGFRRIQDVEQMAEREAAWNLGHNTHIGMETACQSAVCPAEVTPRSRNASRRFAQG